MTHHPRDWRIEIDRRRSSTGSVQHKIWRRDATYVGGYRHVCDCKTIDDAFRFIGDALKEVSA